MDIPDRWNWANPFKGNMLYLRVDKRGDLFTVASSFDARTFREFDRRYAPETRIAMDKAKVGIVASVEMRGLAERKVVDFDFVEIYRPIAK